MHAVYLPFRHRPPKIGAVLDFLVEKFASVPWRLPPQDAAIKAPRRAPRAAGPADDRC
jgi:hypothetical protein